MKSIKEMEIQKVLLFTGIFLIVFFMLTLKIGGASELPVIVEKIGYCKIVHGEDGEDWRYKEDINVCYLDDKKIEFTDEEFREVCQKNKFLSFRFYSKCFHEGGSRWNN